MVANPLINITLQGRHDTYPKRRGMTRVPELMAHGVNVAFGHDCVMDPWYGMGSGDMLEVAHMGLHVAQMTSQDGIRQCFDAVTVERREGVRPRRLRPRSRAATPASCCCRRATRSRRSGCARRGSRCIGRGRLLAETPAATAALHLAGRPAATAWMQPTRH